MHFYCKYIRYHSIVNNLINVLSQPNPVLNNNRSLLVYNGNMVEFTREVYIFTTSSIVNITEKYISLFKYNLERIFLFYPFRVNMYKFKGFSSILYLTTSLLMKLSQMRLLYICCIYVFLWMTQNQSVTDSRLHYMYYMYMCPAVHCF